MVSLKLRLFFEYRLFVHRSMGMGNFPLHSMKETSASIGRLPADVESEFIPRDFCHVNDCRFTYSLYTEVTLGTYV